MKVTVNVTAEDIAKGNRGGCLSCPVAIAMRRALCLPVLIGHSRCFFSGGEVRLPHPVVRFIVRYDSGQPVSPFSFDLDVPDDALAAAGGKA